MEKFSKSFSSEPLKWPRSRSWSLSGVVGSGNLEVLFERGQNAPDKMECHVESSIPGYKASWLAAIGDFAAHYPVGGTRVTIHDQGADPIVVTFRLRQAYDDLLNKKQ